MPYVTVGVENSGSIELYYEDHGEGTPVVLIHGYPLDGHSWEKQIPNLVSAGHRVITYDRRGSGRSSMPATGYDYDTFAADLDALMTTLDLRDAVIIGFSMGTGEVVRYLGNYGSGRVSRAALLAPLAPYLLKTTDNPDGGIDQHALDGFLQACMKDRPAFMKMFLENFFNMDVLRCNRVSDQAFQANWNVATSIAPVAAAKYIKTWITDFRADLPKIDVPILVVQGKADRILPFEATGARLTGMIDRMRLIAIDDGPHAIAWTHAEEVNQALGEFVA